MARTYDCMWCKQPFHPLPKTRRMYCSPKCSAQAHSARAARVRELEAAIAAGSMTPEEITCALAALIKRSDPEGADR
jgi:DNA-directed RNA polymerase subunit RPC12/RpoP